MTDKINEILNRVQKPGRYSGGELNSVIKDKASVDIRFAICFPDSYEVGMSHLGIKIIYGLLNSMEGVWCERSFAPWPDMEQELVENDIPLFSLESKTPLDEFDFVGFTLQYELSYTNVLNMLKLSNMQLYAKERSGLKGIVIAGGPNIFNCEPIADFLDICVIGEAEEVLPELISCYRAAVQNNYSRFEFLLSAAKIGGVYVPSLYDVSYNEDGTVREITPKHEGVPKRIKKRIITDLDNAYYPTDPIVSSISVVHDRAMLEMFRGCIRGCRFCQAGFIYRPVRKKSVDKLTRLAMELIDKTGYEEISLASLSTTDYEELERLYDELMPECEKYKINLSLPSLRIDNFGGEILQRVKKIRKSGLTFAPEAGTQRMRDVINKNITEEQILETVNIAFREGYSGLKLYFMIGLPTETMDDVLGISALAFKILHVWSQCPPEIKRRGVNIGVSVSSFVPKPFTPFEREPQDTIETLKEKQIALKNSINTRKISLSWHDRETSFLEGVFARGDRRLSKVIRKAFEEGCKFDGWSEYFDFAKWMHAFDECGIDPAFYANRRRDEGEVLPWSHIDCGVSDEFFKREAKRAYEGKTTKNCAESCAGCGIEDCTFKTSKL